MARSSATFKMEGDEALRRRLKRLSRAAPRSAAQALNREAEEVVTVAKQLYVPRDLGTLAGTGRVSQHAKPNHLEAEFSFGGPAAPYALAVHEHPSDHSPPSWSGKTVQFKGAPRAGAKYLERPLKDRTRGMGKRIADRVESEIDKESRP